MFKLRPLVDDDEKVTNAVMNHFTDAKVFIFMSTNFCLLSTANNENYNVFHSRVDSIWPNLDSVAKHKHKYIDDHIKTRDDVLAEVIGKSATALTSNFSLSEIFFPCDFFF